jgi:hypothetical protein
MAGPPTDTLRAGVVDGIGKGPIQKKDSIRESGKGVYLMGKGKKDVACL